MIKLEVGKFYKCMAGEKCQIVFEERAKDEMPSDISCLAVRIDDGGKAKGTMWLSRIGYNNKFVRVIKGEWSEPVKRIVEEELKKYE